MKTILIIAAILIVITAALYFIPKSYQGAEKGKANYLFFILSKI